MTIGKQGGTRPWPGRDGATQALAMLVAGAFMGVVTVAVLDTSINMPPPTRQADAATLDVLAASLSETLFEEAGLGWWMGAACDVANLAPDNVFRVGLQPDPACADSSERHNAISQAKFQALRSPAESRQPFNRLLDYEEARASLGLDGGDLHFRVTYEPLESGMNLRAVYLGHYVANTPPVPPVPTTTPTVPPTPPCVGLCFDGPSMEPSPSPTSQACYAAEACYSFADASWSPGTLQFANPINPCITQPFEASDAAYAEANYLERLLPDFVASPYVEVYGCGRLGFRTSGDVIPDVDMVATTVELADRLTSYEGGLDLVVSTDDTDVLVVGSRAASPAFWDMALPPPYDAPSMSDLVDDWVIKAGGMLIVLGEDDPVQWLAEELKTTFGWGYLNEPVESADTLLSDPNALNYLDYTIQESPNGWIGAWYPDMDAYREAQLMILYRNEPWSVGNGIVITSAWQPWDLTGDGEIDCDVEVTPLDCEGRMFLENLLWSYWENYAAPYGPTVPTGTAVGSHQRLMNIRSEAGRIVTTVAATVHVWHGDWSERVYHTFPFDAEFDASASGLSVDETFFLTGTQGTLSVEVRDLAVLSPTYAISIDVWDPAGRHETASWSQFNPPTPINNPWTSSFSNDPGLWRVQVQVSVAGGAGGSFALTASIS